MRRRNKLTALAVIIGGTLAAAAPAQAATAFSCIGAGPASDNIAPGVELNVAFPGDFPEVVTGRRFTIAPTVQYKLSNAYLKRLGQAGVLANGENKLGGITFWVPIAASNTVEGRQNVRAVVQSSANTRVLWDAATQTATVQRYTTAAGVTTPTGPPMDDLAGSTALSTANVYWTPQSAAPVDFSVAPVGTLGSVKVGEQWRRATDGAAAPTDTVIGGTGAGLDVDPLAAARAYGNVYVRLRLGTNRTSLDCATGSISILNSSIAYKEAGNVAAPAGDSGRYTVLAAAAPRFASALPLATAKAFSCIDGLGRYVSRELNAYNIALRAPAPGAYSPGQPYTLSGVEFSVTLPAVMLKGLYSNLLSYQTLPADGHIDKPLKIWVAVQGTGTTQGVQTVLVEGRWTADFDDPDGIPGTGDETFPTVDLKYTLPPSTWTPSGTAPIAFSVAAPGQIPELQLFGYGHSGAAGVQFPMNPYGSIFVRAETGRYGESIDCLEGAIDYADTSIAISNLGRLSPDVKIPEPVIPGAAPSGRTVAAGSLGRYSITHTPAAPFAVVPAVTTPATVAPIAAPVSKPAVRSTKLVVKKSKVALALGCEGSATACTGTVTVKSTSKVTVGKSKKIVSLTKALKYTVAANGKKTVSLALTSQAKSVLKNRKKLSVTVTIKPTTGAAVTRKVTLVA
jgi:hypothetical protein